MKIEVQSVEVYEPKWVKRRFQVYSKQWIAIKKRINGRSEPEDHRCFRCRKRFDIGDAISLVGFHDRLNEISCLDCGEAIFDQLAYEHKIEKDTDDGKTDQ